MNLSDCVLFMVVDERKYYQRYVMVWRLKSHLA